ncbi:MAG TPA: amino acid adenylation domain-containing protein, partial [Thermoanaerobaculia bacterium]|nr:amino acid adenylation domain-containing protein [Thermoanaerobaculia bacterium]
AALLGVLKAGATYVPLDPAYPADWLSHAAEDAQITLLLTEARFRGRLAGRREVEATEEALAREAEENPEPLAEPSNLAYVMYTSGSTGRPKGVALEHRAPVERMCWARAAFPAEALAGVLASTSICFDLSVFEIFAPLSWGGTVILAENALALSTLPAAGEVTLLNTVPSAMAELAASELPPRLRTVSLAGEALSPPLAERIYRHEQIEQVLNLYGPTEDATYSTWARVERGASRVSIGCPLPGTRAYVLDRHLEPVPGGVPGELFLAGAGGARGYLGRADLTAEKFIPDPFGMLYGGRLYRTGDLVRWLASGELQHLGRLDHQVKVRGFRIELEEIERVLREHPQVREAAVVVRESPVGGRSLAAFVAPPEAGVPELRRHLDGRLPAYMIPSSFQLLPALPRTLNGKIDRRALPAGASAAAAFVAPRTPMEEVLAGLWSEVLGLEKVGVHENFFDLGGHSLLAGRVVSRLHAVFGVELPLRTLFERPSVEKLAVAVEEARTGRVESAAPPLVPVPRDRHLPLSFAQERLWFLDRLEPGQAVYNVPMVLRLRGPVSAPVLAAALAAVAERHEVLRATFTEVAGQSVQEISAAARFPLAVVDLTELPPAARPAEAARQAFAEARHPFDLATGPLCRAALLRLEANEHLFLLDLHHIVFDGWSTEVLLRDLGSLYAGEPLPPLPVQHADFAAWQRAWIEGGALAAQLDAWRERLDGAPTALDLPLDHPRPAAQTFHGGAEPVTLPADLVRELRAAGRHAGATLFMTVLAGWSTLLHRVSGAPEMLVGTPVANRRQPELGDLIGLFVNTLPLRIDLGGDPLFVELLGRVRATALAAYENQDLPFERLVEAVGAERDLSRNPLFQVMLALTEGAPPSLRLPGVTAEEVPLHNGTAKLELLLALTGADGALSGGLEFNADLFDAATARRLTGQLARLLTAAAAGPELRIGDLPLLTPAEERQILVDWNATAAPFPRDLGLHELFEAQAARTPQATALLHGEQRVTYGELNAQAEGLARHLCALGVGPEVLVGVFCGRTPGMVAAALAVLKAGGAYLPLDPAYPADRLSFLLADSGASVVLAEQSVAAALPAFAGSVEPVGRSDDWETGEDEARERPRGFVHPGQAAYAIYTSGSTGVPKGVLIRHGSAVARITWALSAYPQDVLAGVLAATSLCFDLSVFEIFAPL